MTVIPVVVGAFGTIDRDLGKKTERAGRIETIQTTTKSVRIRRRVKIKVKKNSHSKNNKLIVELEGGNLLSFLLLRCGTRPHEWGTQ